MLGTRVRLAYTITARCSSFESTKQQAAVAGGLGMSTDSRRIDDHAADSKSGTVAAEPRRSELRALVEHASAAALAIATSLGSFAWDIFDGICWFRCPRCRGDRQAVLRDGATWKCLACGHEGTSFELEQAVLGSPRSLEALMQLTDASGR